MADERGQADDPTSYGLQPAAGPAGPAAGPARSAAASPRADPAATAPAGYPAAGGPADGPDRPDGDGAPQRVVGGRYRLTGRLGHGGMGTVWRARDAVVGREVAVKEPRVPGSITDSERENVHRRMRREARAAARIGHPSVVTVYDVVIEDGRPWLVMELVHGESLAEVLESGTLGVRETARVGLAVLGALAAAHEAGVLHRDVKPANVLLGRNDRVVLTDFGIAQVEGEQGLTDTGAFVGSPEFTAPERVLGRRPGPESDLWSLGVLMYAALEGFSPFRRYTVPATVQAVLTADAQPPARESGELGALVLRLLSKEPSARPAVAEVRETLLRILAPPPAEPVATRGYPAQGGESGDGGDGVPGKGGRGRRPGRGARLTLAGGPAGALVLVLLLLVADPFGRGGLPEGWELREEEEPGVTWAVPEGFVRDSAEDSSWIRYTSPDTLYEIQLWYREEEERDALAAAAGQLSHLRESNARDTGMEDVTGRFYERDFHDYDAAEMELTSVPHRSEEGAPRVQRRALFLTREETDRMWRVQVVMPGEEGAAKAYGEELYEEVLTHLALDDAQEPGEGD
ncbi:serine/threonine-protein kinase [Streptomyces sp. ACA25]|uniref:serine/threonine-protein kinase n=1 Tax=Streptomyces sp. ACA25 TaxID=3022596 RepID=UPI002307D31B|nr:serine/threonine-protein kinase [Streptomyces sp. ACA25]MDB1087399.1 serine/threonine-protein kinase [Streptomyces sp. ACA25]